MSKGVLIVDDEADSRERILRQINKAKLKFDPVLQAGSSVEARAKWEREKAVVGTVVLDINLQKEGEGWELLRHFKETKVTDFEVLVYSGNITGIKPILESVGNQTFSLYIRNRDEDLLWNKLSIISSRLPVGRQEPIFSEGERKEMLAVSNFPFPLLLVGPPGSSKSTKAAEIARLSGCEKNRIFVINSSSLSPYLADSELYGSVSSGFTGAATRVGMMLRASGFDDKHLEKKKVAILDESPKGYPAYRSREPKWGAIILDEVATLDPAVQAKLLLALEGEPMRPVGWDGDGFLPNFRVIAATNQLDDLKTDFRKDLLRRLTTHIIDCPEIHDEPDDKIVQIIKQHSVEIRRRGELVTRVKPLITDGAVGFILDRKNRREIKGGIREVLALIDRACIKSFEMGENEASEMRISEDVMKLAWKFSVDKVYTFYENEGSREREQRDDFSKDEVDAVRHEISTLLNLDSSKLNENSLKTAIKATVKGNKSKEKLKGEIRAVIAHRYQGNKTWPGFALLGRAVGVARDRDETLEHYGLRVRNNCFNTPFREPEKEDSTE
ncbi:MAG: sigma 54-interacting transcriptional regulator [Pyrinomonadaceae bacterium]